MNTYEELYRTHTKLLRELSNSKYRLELHPEDTKLKQKVKQLELDKQALTRVMRMFQK